LNVREAFIAEELIHLDGLCPIARPHILSRRYPRGRSRWSRRLHENWRFVASKLRG
jgi:hypothetical protein